MIELSTWANWFVPCCWYRLSTLHSSDLFVFYQQYMQYSRLYLSATTVVCGWPQQQ